MTALRTQMKWILWTLVFAFLGTIIFSWGMGGFKSREKQGLLGEIDNQDITLERFQQLVRFEQQRAESETEGGLDQKKIKRLREDAWDNEVERILKWNDAKRLNIQVTDRQVAYLVETFPPNEIREVETFQTDGKFDIELYREFLRRPEALKYLMDIESRVQSFLLEQELTFLVSQCTDVPYSDVLDEFFTQAVTGKLHIISIPLSETEVDSAEVTEKMMRKYYQLFSSKFKKYPESEFAYVKFKIEATPEDSADVLQEANELIKEIVSGEDFAELAGDFSQDDGTRTVGGDLGWFDYDAMNEPFSEAAFDAEPNDLVGPVLSKNGYHIILIEDTRTKEGVAEVKARHILLKIEPSADTRDQVYDDAYNFAQDVKERDFRAVAEEYGYEIDSSGTFSEAGYIKGLSRMRMAAQFCFNNPVGTTSDVYPIPAGYVVFTVTSVTEETTKPYEEVEKSIRKSILKVLKKHKNWDRAADLRAQIETFEDLEKVASEAGLRVYTTDDSLRPGDKLPAGLKSDKDLMKIAFRLEEGEISEIIQTKKGCYIVYMEHKSPWSKEDLLTFHSSIYQTLVSKKQDQAVKNWIRELRIAADRKDYRYKYFRDF